MTPPPSDIVQGCVVFLRQQQDLLSLLGSTVDDSTGLLVPWLFQEECYAEVEGSSQAAVVVSYDGPSAGTNIYNTAEFLRLRVDVWSDPPRDSLLSPTKPWEARMYIKQIGRVLDNYLHRVQGGSQAWDTVIAGTSTKIRDMTYWDQPDHNRVMKGTTWYTVQVDGYLV